MATTSRPPVFGPYPKALERFPKIRQSTLSAFDSCSLAAKFESDYRRGWSTHPQARGQTFHRTAAACLRTMSRLGEPSIPVDAALAHLHDSLRQVDVDRICPACGSGKIKRGVKDGMRTCGACGCRFETELMNLPMKEVKELRMVVIKWANDNSWDIENLVDVEHRLDADVEYPDPAGGSIRRTVTGQLDAMFIAPEQEDHAIVLDWKDTWGMPGPTDVSFGGYFQQRMYGWLLMRNYPSIQRVTLREFYVRYSEPREVTLWRDSLDDVEQEFSALVERFDRSIHEGAFTPTPGKHCHWCMRPTACPVLPEARGYGRVRTESESVVMTRQLVVAQAAVEQARNALMGWADVHGPIPINDAKGPRALGYRETKTTVRPTRDALEAALATGKVDLDELYVERTGTRFEQHRAPRVKLTDEDVALQASLEGALAEARATHEEDRR